MSELAKVCEVSKLPPGNMKSVEYRGIRILVINYENEYYAINGTCTHEEAELSSDFLLDDAITCPLHLSQFDIKTGRALSPPAKDPLQKYNVKIIDSIIYVEMIKKI